MRIPLLPSLRLVAVAAAVLMVLPEAAMAHSPSGDVTEAELADQLAAARERLGDDIAAAGEINEPVSDGFELVGHDPLFNRGMNAALAVHGDYVYVGNRTDGQPHHPHPGILVVDVSDPTAPEVVHEIGRPAAAQVGETSREMRVWPEQNLLIVLNFGCSSAIHACAGGETQGSRVTFFDIAGEKAAAPELVATYQPSRVPHEFFLWVDPAQPAERALLFSSTPTGSTTRPNIIATDISRARDGEFPETEWVAEFEGGEFENGESEDRRLHSLALTPDGKRAYLAFLGSGFLVLDTSQVTAGMPEPAMELVTPPENRAKWSNPGAHTSIKIPGRESALTTDEVYGDALDALGPHGCPWGWVRTLDIADETKPTVVAEYKLEQNHEEYCDTAEGSDPANTTFTSYSAHNPTLTPDLAFITWHSSGLEAIAISDPANPRHVGNFSPEPLEFVATEDPALSAGRNKVVMWSYPIIKDGLIYVVDIRNGLYVLRYTGPRSERIAAIDFLEGNSNLGAALRYEPPSPPTAQPRGIANACPDETVPESGRTDAQGNVHKAAINCVIWWDIAAGTSPTRYDVASNVNRAQMASFIAQLIETSGGTLPDDAPDAFSDDDGSVHEANINSLAAAGLVDGKTEGGFAPHQEVSRGQMAKLLVRAYELVSEHDLTAVRDFFTDDDGTTHEESINKSATAGFGAGEGGAYRPSAPPRRDQMASFLARVLDLLVAEGTTPGKE